MAAGWAGWAEWKIWRCKRDDFACFEIDINRKIYKEKVMKLRPLDDGVVIMQLEAEEKTTGGIILPDTAKEKPQMGKVVAVGPGKTLDNGKLMPMSVKKGVKVIYGKYVGNDVEIDGEKYVVLKESDILAIVEK